MKSQKLIVLASAACLLLGVSGAAMAVDCATGNIIGQTVDAIEIDGQSCYMERVVVTGDVTVIISEDLTMYRVDVGGTIRVIGGGSAILVANTAGEGIAARNNETASLLANIAVINIRVINNLKATVKKNVTATLVCRDNHRLDAFENEAAVDNCRALGGFFDDL